MHEMPYVRNKCDFPNYEFSNPKFFLLTIMLQKIYTIILYTLREEEKT